MARPRTGPLSDQNVQTLVIVTFLLSLLSLGLNAVSYVRMNQLVDGTQQIYRTQRSTDAELAERVSVVESVDRRQVALENRIEALENELSALRGGR